MFKTTLFASYNAQHLEQQAVRPQPAVSRYGSVTDIEVNPDRSSAVEPQPGARLDDSRYGEYGDYASFFDPSEGSVDLNDVPEPLSANDVAHDATIITINQDRNAAAQSSRTINSWVPDYRPEPAASSRRTSTPWVPYYKQATTAPPASHLAEFNLTPPKPTTTPTPIVGHEVNPKMRAVFDEKWEKEKSYK
jgi:hypothetical protein